LHKIYWLTYVQWEILNFNILFNFWFNQIMIMKRKKSWNVILIFSDLFKISEISYNEVNMNTCLLVIDQKILNLRILIKYTIFYLDSKLFKGINYWNDIFVCETLKPQDFDLINSFYDYVSKIFENIIDFCGHQNLFKPKYNIFW
jgi:hypothetical protein